MAVKQSKSKSKSKKEVVVPVEEWKNEEQEVKKETKPKKKEGLWMNVGWALLLVGGLAHMLPDQMAPLLKWAMYGVSLQTAVGALSVVVALYFLLGD